jgi:conjugal transfer mating pair stabilization protein TraG
MDMEYTIYSYGSGEILEKVFNVLAMLCKAESIFFRPVLMLTATVGGTWSALRAIFGHNPSIFVRDWMLPTVLIFNLMFVPRVTVNIVDNVDTFHHYMRVDHVPVGPALIGHIASNLSYFLTEKIEERLVPAEYANLTYGKTGPMFAANLMMASQDLTISDPILRDNIKSYVDQCYTWPYLYTNIAGKREEALRTPDILGFMRANPHKGLGMYWKGAAGQPTFCKCSQVPEKLSGGMDRECGKALSKIASQVMPGISVQNPERARTVISPVAESAWHAIAKDSTTAHKRVEQLMVINAAREAIDDSLEKFGNERRFKRLISYSATRAEQQQNSGFLIAGLTAARQLPLLQGVFLSLLLVSFTVVVAFTFIPGGLKIWGMWIKMIIWVESWPIFFGILNCIGLLWLEKSLATITQTESGITWLSQSGLAESSWTAYCIVQNFFLAVPFLSWAIISQSGHALVSMAERALPTLGQALGQNIVDNNQTFDTQSFNNRSMNGFQMAQQNLGANYSLGRAKA